MDEAIRPVPGAVLAANGGHNATSDANGVFRMGFLEPGFYVLDVRAPGYVPAQTTAEVVADATATLKVQLLRDLSPQPYHVTWPYQGVMQAWVGIGQFFVEDAADMLLNDSTVCDCSYSFTPDPNVSTIVLEAFWDPAAPDPAELGEYYWEVGGDVASEFYETGYCYSPCHAVVPLKGFRQGEAVHVRFTGPDFWVAYQQQIQIYTTTFHNGEAPEGWSIGGTDG